MTIYYYPCDGDWYNFQWTDYGTLVHYFSDDFDYIDYTSFDDSDTLIHYLQEIYDLPNGIYNEAVMQFHVDSLDHFKQLYPELFI